MKTLLDTYFSRGPVPEVPFFFGAGFFPPFFGAFFVAFFAGMSR